MTALVLKATSFRRVGEVWVHTPCVPFARCWWLEVTYYRSCSKDGTI